MPFMIPKSLHLRQNVFVLRQKPVSLHRVVGLQYVGSVYSTQVISDFCFLGCICASCLIILRNVNINFVDRLADCVACFLQHVNNCVSSVQLQAINFVADKKIFTHFNCFPYHSLQCLGIFSITHFIDPNCEFRIIYLTLVPLQSIFLQILFCFHTLQMIVLIRESLYSRTYHSRLNPRTNRQFPTFSRHDSTSA